MLSNLSRLANNFDSKTDENSQLARLLGAVKSILEHKNKHYAGDCHILTMDLF